MKRGKRDGAKVKDTGHDTEQFVQFTVVHAQFSVRLKHVKPVCSVVDPLHSTERKEERGRRKEEGGRRTGKGGQNERSVCVSEHVGGGEGGTWLASFFWGGVIVFLALIDES